MSEKIPPSLASRFINTLSQSLSVRTLVVFLLGILMMIPLFMVEDVVQERSQYHNNVLKEVAATWGEKQILVGPLLVVPYVEHFTSVDTVIDANGENRIVSKDIYNDHTAILLPKELEIRSDLKEEHRQRGIYDALVYTAKLSMTGQFDHTPLLRSDEGERRILWDKAYIVVGISDTKAIDVASSFFWDDERIALEPGTRMTDLTPTGFHALLPSTANSNASHEFKLTMNLRGSDSLMFAPLGETSKFRMTSSWAHPSFRGELLPEKHEISEQGFSAEWNIPHLVRNYPQYWDINDKQTYKLQDFLVGVSLYEPASLYTKVTRAMKYGAALFIGLTFLVFLAFEISLKRRFHILQYLIVGGALALFFLILLALAEQIGFMFAYLAAATTTILLITLYMKAILRDKKHTTFIFLLLTVLYGVLYLILQMEDYALLAGVVLLLISMGSMMYVTRHLKA